MPHFRWSFQKKIAGAHPIAHISVAIVWWPTRNISRHLEWWKWLWKSYPFIGYVRFPTPRRNSRVWTVFSTRDVKEENDSSQVLRRVGKAYRVERLLPSQCGKTWHVSKQTWLPSWPTLNITNLCTVQYLGCYVALILGLLKFYTIHNNDNASIQYEYLRGWLSDSRG